MKEIKAYVRRGDVNEVVERLQAAGAPGVSVIEIHPVGYGYEPSGFEPHAARLVQRYRYLAIVKLEIICPDHQLGQLLEAIQGCCRTGGPGDGMIFVSEIANAIRIRDGVSGEDALRQKTAPGRSGVERDAPVGTKA
jgi:nitrogen regulatory protein PII